MYKSIHFLSVIFFSEIFAQSDTAEYFPETFQRNTDFIYKENIKTALLHRDGFELSTPVMALDSEEKLKLSFDDFVPELKSYGYYLEHCNANWQPSELMPVEYIKGVQEDYINDYKYSRNTTFKYIHYNVIFPNSNFTITKSGNYLLRVFLDDKENIFFTKRFMVRENKATVVADIHRATGVDDRMYKQEIDFTIQYDAYQITNPYTDLKVSVLQNHRWDNAVNTLKPTFVKDNELLYDYSDENIFNGGNEFRHFDIKNFRFNTDRIDSVVFNSASSIEGGMAGAVHIYLLTDKKNAFKGYVSKQDINGKLLIGIDGKGDSEIDADYAFVHFSFSYKDTLTKGNVYILGALSDWNFSKNFQLCYNAVNQKFEATVFLKQGYYNYQYVFVEDGKNSGNETMFEGNHSQTGNDYTILVYHRSFSDNYDRLISVLE